MPTQPPLPDDLPHSPAAAYLLGYGHGQRAARGRAAAKLGSAKSDAKSAAARANGAKGGRPRKTPVVTDVHG